jgi:hypothetical protein
MEVSGQVHSRYPLDRRLGGPRSGSGRGCEEKNSQPLPELNPGRPAQGHLTLNYDMVSLFFNVFVLEPLDWHIKICALQTRNQWINQTLI